MTTIPTNRFLTNALRTLCCAGLLTACSAWATVVTWQLNPIGDNGSLVTKDVAQPAYTSTARGFGNTAGTDASNQLSFKSAPESQAASLADVVSENLEVSANNIQLESREALSQADAQISAVSAPSNDSFLVVDSQPQPVLQSGGALAHAFDEEFVSVPTIQFASTALGSKDVQVSSPTAIVPEMSALFPIVGLIAAVSFTQILRRRRAAQLGGPRNLA
jgi:hypothetical protein